MIQQYFFQLSRFQFQGHLIVFFMTGIFSMSAQTPCNRPDNLAVQSIYNNGGTVTWDAADPTPLQGYDYFWSASQGNAPTSSSVPDGSTFATSVTITGNFVPGATIYVWVRSSCSSGNSLWRGPVNFTIIPPGNGCPVAPNGLKPDNEFTPAYTGSPEIINADANAGEYCKVNVMANRQFVFNTSVPNDYITVANINTAEVIAHGPSPLIWNSGSFSGLVRYYISSNSSCDTSGPMRTRYITGQLVPTGCTGPTGFYNSSITTNSAIIHWTNANSTYPESFSYYYSTSSTTPNINDTPSGTTTFEYKELSGLAPSTTYYYWLRANCQNGTSTWTYGGSFTTQSSVVTGCTSALYGQHPSTVFVPGCFGNQEIIATDMWAGEYSLINILPNKIYTFTSSVGTDFITIRDNATSVAYTSGTTPLTWASGGNTAQIKMFVHLSVVCGSQNVNRTTTITCQDAPAGCLPPSALAITAVTNNSANLNWVAANPSPSNGYHYYFNTSGTPPSTSTPPSGNAAGTNISLNGLNANTTYYFWVRSNCGTSQSTWVFGNSFATVGTAAGCTSAVYGQYPAATFTPACFGNNEVIATDAFAGEYSVVNVSANTQYTFTSSVASDYITITNADASITYTAGITPLVWNSGSTGGEVRYYFHVNSACGANNGNRTRYVACQVTGSCATPGGLWASNVSTSGATINWAAASPLPGNGYQYYINTTGIAPTAATAPSGSSSAPTVSLTGLVDGTTFYFWVRSNCGTSQSSWSASGSFSTLPIAVTGCTDAPYFQHPLSTFTPSCSGSNQLIVNNAYAGEFSMVNISADKQYTFSSSVSTDYITISNEDASVVYASGITPLVWQSGINEGVLKYYLHTNAACGYEMVNRSKYITCSTALGESEMVWENLKWHPNPVSDILYINHTQILDKIDVFTLLGQSLYNEFVGRSEAYIDFSGFADGIYLVRITSENQSKVLRLIKE